VPSQCHIHSLPAAITEVTITTPQTVITVTLVITEKITKIMKKLTSVVIIKTIIMITIVITELTAIIMEQKMETIIITTTQVT
jgi:hypothetical protein